MGKNITDLATGSAAVTMLSKIGTNNPKIRTHIIQSSASSAQREASEDMYLLPLSVGAYMRWAYGCDLLPDGGFDQLLGVGNDLIVSRDSQAGAGLGLNVFSIPSSSVPGSYIHAVDATLFPLGPSILGEVIDENGDKGRHASSSAIRDHLIEKLNARAGDQSIYREIRP